VENILVIGHSRCGGIQALMKMEDEGDSRFLPVLDSIYRKNPLIVVELCPYCISLVTEVSYTTG